MTDTAVPAWPFVGRARELAQTMDLLSRSDRFGVVIAGPSGVGKSRLARAAAEQAAHDGWSVVRVYGNPGTSAVPLGAVAHLLPEGVSAGDAPIDPLSRFRLAVEAIDSEVGPTGAMLVLVDDLTLLDGASITLLTQLLHARRVRLLATVRDGSELSEGARAVLHSEQVDRIGLGQLSRNATARLIRTALGGPVGAELIAACWNSSQGNHLYLRELVTGAVERGSMVRRAGVWHLDAPLVGTSLLTELIGARLAGIDSAARDVAELLALCEPISVDLLERNGVLDAALELEAAGLLVINPTAGRSDVRLAHPLYSEVLRSQIPPLRRRQAILGHIEQIARAGARRREDSMRIAVWQLEIGVGADPAVLLQGAQVARAASDFAVAARLAAAAVERGSGLGAQGVLGQSLYELGRFDEADEVFARAILDEADELTATIMAVGRHNVLLWGLADPSGATAVLLESLERLTDPVLRGVVTAALANVAAFSGDPRRAVEVFDGLGDLGDLVLVAGAIPAVPSLAQLGRTERARELAEQANLLHLAMDDPASISPPGILRVVLAFALVEAGELVLADEVAAEGFELANEQRVPLLEVWFSLLRARGLMFQGRFDDAIAWYTEGLDTADAIHLGVGRRMALSGLAASSGQQGAAASASEAAELLAACPPDAGFLRHEMAYGFAWSAVANGDPESARSTLRIAALAAENAGQLTIAAGLWCELARLGSTEGLERMSSMAGLSDGRAVAIRYRFVAALDARDPGALDEVADAFGNLGARHLAAEAASLASREWRRSGRPRAAERSQRVSERWRATCQGLFTPAVAVFESPSPLSAREREVALLAAGGHPSREIADRLHLSVRTVDNHLQRVYAKLGIRSRREIRSALAR